MVNHQNLKKIETTVKELVPVYETDQGEKVVYGSDLHKVLGVKSNYREWALRRFVDCDAVETVDYQGVEISTPSGQRRSDHLILLDTAKEMAMLERNANGKKVRRYFILVEKKYKEMVEEEANNSKVSADIPIMSAEELAAYSVLRIMEQSKIINELTARVTALEDKLIVQKEQNKEETVKKIVQKTQNNPSSYEDIMNSRTYPVTTTVIAKDYGMDARKLNVILCMDGIQFKNQDTGNWEPCEKYRDAGIMQAIPFINHFLGTTISSYKWTRKGNEFIRSHMKMMHDMEPSV